MPKWLVLTPFLIGAFSALAEDPDDYKFQKRTFVIVTSTRRYDEALAAAKNASKKLKLKLDLRDLVANPETGLTLPKEECETQGGYPCYVARGRNDSGEYVSIEFSTGFKDFAPDYYFIITASGEKEDLGENLKKARKIFPDAYMKTADVNMQCMH